MRSPRTLLFTPLLPLVLLVGACSNGSGSGADEGPSQQLLDRRAVCADFCEPLTAFRDDPCDQVAGRDQIFQQCGDFLDAHVALVDELEPRLAETGLYQTPQMEESIARVRVLTQAFHEMECATSEGRPPAEDDSAATGEPGEPADADEATEPADTGQGAGFLPPIPELPDASELSPAPGAPDPSDRSGPEHTPQPSAESDGDAPTPPTADRDISAELAEELERTLALNDCLGTIHHVRSTGIDIGATIQVAMP